MKKKKFLCEEKKYVPMYQVTSMTDEIVSMCTQGKTRAEICNRLAELAATACNCKIGFIGEMSIASNNADFKLHLLGSCGLKRNEQKWVVVKEDSPLHTLAKGQTAFSNSSVPEMKLKTFFGAPIVCPDSCHKRGNAIFVVGNFCDASTTRADLEEKLQPFLDLAQLVLSGFNVRRLQRVYTSIVNNLQTPIIVFQRKTCCDTGNSASVRTLEDLKCFDCLFYNQSFKAEADDNVLGMGVFDCFPQLRFRADLIKKLLCVFQEGSPSIATADAVVYEDRFIEKDIYTIKFTRANQRTFVITIESISEQLKAKVLAEEMAQTKEQFVANVSHEIRTPLNGILGYISMLSDPNEQQTMTDYQRNCFEQIRDCSMNLLYIMNDILDFSKLNADQMQLKTAPFDVTECLEKSYDIILPSAHEKGLEGAFYIQPNVPPRIKGDFKKLRQILLNLLSNGVKFTTKGRVDTTVKLLKDPVTNSEIDVQGHYTLEFTVEDTGIGINPKNQEKLFKSFSQIDQSNHKIYQGTGLGLVITKKLVELMGGTIRAESVEGEGSKFIFTIKVEEARATSSEASLELLPLLKDRTVLVVDDHITNRITIASNLVQWGMKPFVCGSAEEALLYLRGGVMHFDMALIDMRMPKIDGKELAEKIKAIEANLPLIAVSSVPLTSSILGNKNFSFYLSKPIKQRQLFNVCVATIRRVNNAAESSTAKLAESPPRSQTPKQSRFMLDPELTTQAVNTGYSTLPIGPCKNTDRSILIAEDLRMNQRVIQGLLEKLGFRDITVVEDGRAAIERIGARHYDIVMMDLKMPLIDGFEATRRIRRMYQQAKKTQPFIIALTANATNGIQDRCAAAGMDAYLSKPMDASELAKILDEACK